MMYATVLRRLVIVAGASAALGCGASAHIPLSAGQGPHPTLPRPRTSFIPVVNVVDARGWPNGAKPSGAEGTKVSAFATGLAHPRWLYVLPNGDVLVAEADGPPRPDDAKGVKGFVYRMVQRRAGAGTPSANRITLLRNNGNGIASKTIFLDGLNSPFGMTLIGNELYVANTDA